MALRQGLERLFMGIFEYLDRRRLELRKLARQLTLAPHNLAVSGLLRWRIGQQKARWTSVELRKARFDHDPNVCFCSRNYKATKNRHTTVHPGARLTMHPGKCHNN